MEFMTTEYVKEQAALGALPALKCSLKHHEQGRDAGKVELINAIKEGRFVLGPSHCACCHCFSLNEVECGKCLLYDKTTKKDKCCDNRYAVMVDKFWDFTADYSNVNFKAFQEAEKALCTYIEKKITEEEAKAEKSPCVDCNLDCPKKTKSADLKALDKPELRHGDYGLYTHKDGTVKFYVDKEGTLRFIGGTLSSYNCDYATQPLRDDVEINLLGNLKDIFDDLAAIAEPIEGFEMKLDTSEESLNAYIATGDRGGVVLTVKDSGVSEEGTVRINKGKELHNFILRLQRVEAKLQSEK